MWCQDVWTAAAARKVAQTVLGLRQTTWVTRVERWRSEWEDDDHPWVEWRVYNLQGRRHMTQRDADPSS
ncbi:MAG: hypothetical protein M1415_05455 [Firmicutes bacterium]|jgi:hypothetical protein|nr:hypothetical protein [Bacillota bacterium]MCL5064179.1 hypothetical protein [Bacillota bacterium]